MGSAQPVNRTLAEPARGPGEAGGAAARPAMEPVDGDDAADLAAAAAGSVDAFGRLYDRHAAVVMSLCRRLSPSEAEDALQETFFRAHRMLDKVHDPGGLRSWLYAIARRVCSERGRAASRRRRHEEAAAMNASRAESLSVPHAGESAAQDEDLRRLERALDRLEERERLAIHLHYLEADPVKAAAAALGLSRSGYYKLLDRARSRLANLLSPTQGRP